MLILGLTGSIGMGKSTVAAMFRRLGVPVFDADACVHGLQGPGGRALAGIETLFPGTTGPGGVDRVALGRAVFGDPAALRRLERLIHPMVWQGQQAFLRRNRSHGFVVLDVPLLFEKGGWRRVDRIAVVSAPAWMQRRRVLRRPGMTQARLAGILALQTPDAEKRRRADFILSTAGGLGATRAGVRHLVACLSRRAGRYERHA